MDEQADLDSSLAYHSDKADTCGGDGKGVHDEPQSELARGAVLLVLDNYYSRAVQCVVDQVTTLHVLEVVECRDCRAGKVEA